MKRLSLYRRFLIWRLRRRRLISCSAIISAVYGRAFLDRIAPLAVDRRTVMSLAAPAAGMTEEELYLRVSSASGYPYLKQIPLIELSELPARFDLEHFRTFGCIPLLRDQLIEGLVCCEPGLLGELLRPGERMAIYLSTWEAVASAIEASKELSARSYEQEREARVAKLAGLARQGLDRIVGEAERYGACAVMIELGAAAPNYSFELPSGGKATGTVSEILSEALQKILDEACTSSDDPKLTVRRQPFNHAFEIRLGDADLIKLPCTREPVSARDTPKQDPDLVLLVDDNRTFSTVLERFLGKQGLRTLSAPGAREALALLEGPGRLPALIVCDIHMPEMNGIEFIRAVRQRFSPQEMPVIMLTSDTRADLELDAIERGADAYLQKSEEPRLLSAYIFGALRRSAEVAAA